jgi:hypothetical protein
VDQSNSRVDLFRGEDPQGAATHRESATCRASQLDTVAQELR